MSNEFRQFLLRQTELEKQARQERLVKEALKAKEQRTDRKEQKQNTLLTRISVLF